MKKFLLLSLCFISLNTFSQNEVAKSGWNFGALPTITFDTDLGFQYGALVNLYHYGDGSRYPRYDHSLYFEVSRYTKGSGINRFYYDSDKLIKGLQTSLDISFLSDQAYDFFGFNGYEAVVNEEWMDSDHSDYISRMFYKYDRKLFRMKVDLQGRFSSDHLRWAAGINLLDFSIDKVNIDKLNKGKKDSDLLPDVPGLYDIYKQHGLFSDEEADGGFIPELKAGVVYDTRDNRPNPMKGMWTEAMVVGAPEFLGAESGFLKLSLTHRQYFTIIANDLALAYRLNYQTTIAGHAPFYYQTQVVTSEMKSYISEGLGGLSSLRGIRRNRVVGDGYLLGNIEARWKFYRFRFINNNFYLGLNGFTDFGRVTKKIEVNYSDDIFNDSESRLVSDFFDKESESFHLSFGAGLRIAMNENFIIKVDYGVAADKRDGNSGLYIGLNYLF